MGKDLKNKELGVGLSQRKDGRYSARFVGRNGKRIEKYFTKLSEARKWMRDAKYEDEHGSIISSSQMTVDAWFEYWINEIKANTVRSNTVRNYKERYHSNIKNLLGNMIISEVKPMHCQMVLNLMDEKYSGSTMEQARITMHNMFASAEENEIISQNPVRKSVKCTKPIEKKTRVLTLAEQKKFLDVAKSTSNYYQYLFLLQTGLRTGEMIGLKWEDIDFKNKVIHIRRTMEYRYSVGDYRIGEPKSKSGYRDIPMTEISYQILCEKDRERKERKVSLMEYSDFVFLNRKGMPTKNSTYDSQLYKLADKAGIERFSMHTLRHTFATRCIEAGMRPKTLQQILGHSNIDVTMNLYVHVTDDVKKIEMQKFEKNYKMA